jgi:hypothetical protein
LERKLMRALIVCGIVVLASLTPAIAGPHAKHGSDAACDAKCAGKVPGIHACVRKCMAAKKKKEK